MTHTPDPIAETRNWLERAVIGLNLCPFAKAVYVKQQVRFVLSDASTPEALLEQLAEELLLLRDTPADEIDTTLIVHPDVLQDFLDYNDFLDNADAAVEALDLEGVLQVASFHPSYQFAGTAFERHQQLHQPFALPDAAFVARRQRQPGGGRVSGRGRDRGPQRGNAGQAGLGRLAELFPS